MQAFYIVFMDLKDLSQHSKQFLKNVLGSGEKWLAEEIKKISENSSDEKDFLEEVVLYLTRIEIKIRTLKEEGEKLSGL